MKRRLSPSSLALLAALAAAPARAAGAHGVELPAAAELPVLTAPLGVPSAPAVSPEISALERKSFAVPSLPLPSLPTGGIDISANWRESPSARAGVIALHAPMVGASGISANGRNVPAAATALSRLQASMLDGAAASKPQATWATARSLAGKAFDGASEMTAAGGRGGVGDSSAPPVGAAERDAPELPPYLAVPDPAQAAWVAAVWAEASRSVTGRAILGRVRRLAQKRGRPMIVVVAPIGNAGEYAFDHEIVTMDTSHMARPPVETAAVFMHELAHVLQLAQGLPTDAFEMELEAYLVQFRVAEELGFKPKRGTFHWSAFRRFKNDVDRFMAWLLKEYDGNLAIVGKGSLEEYEVKLDERHAEATAKLGRLEKRAAAKRRVIERMAATNQPAGLIEQYRLDELAPLEEKLRVERRGLGWIERDLLLLRTPESRERYRRYAERVLKKARAYHDLLAAGVDG